MATGAPGSVLATWGKSPSRNFTSTTPGSKRRPTEPGAPEGGTNRGNCEAACDCEPKLGTGMFPGFAPCGGSGMIAAPDEPAFVGRGMSLPRPATPVEGTGI